MELQTLKASTRQPRGKGAVRKIRATGALPGVLYGGEGGSVPLALDLHQFELLVHGRGGEHAIVRIEVQDKPELSTPALVKAVYRHPTKETILHADLFRISLDKRITTLVPIRLVGQPVGVVDGGVIDYQTREVEVECLALEVPEHIEVDVSGLHIGQSIHVGQLQAPENVTIMSDPERPVVAVHAPRAVKEEVPAEAAVVEGAEAAEAAGPEVITEKKPKEEEKEPEKKKGKEKEK